MAPSPFLISFDQRASPMGRPVSRQLFGGDRHHFNRAIGATLLARVEKDATIGQREQGVILADADIDAGVKFGATLAHKNVARNDRLAAELLDAKATAR